MPRRHLLTATAAAIVLAGTAVPAVASGDSKERDKKEPERAGAVSQSASSSQILPITIGAALAIPINANIPISILSGPAQAGDVAQEGEAEAGALAVGSGIIQSAG